MMSSILIVDDEEGIRSFLQEALELDDHHVLCAADGLEALQILQKQPISLMISDLKMPHMDGITLLQQSLHAYPQLTVVMLTAYGSIDIAVKAMKIGAFDFLQKPLESPKELRAMVKRALAHHQAQTNHPTKTPTPATITPSAPDDPDDPRNPPISYGAPIMEPIVEALRKVAPTLATVLLTGESGTGKEVAARKLHLWSQRANGPFVAINCAALSEQLLESELFGHEKGAFTGAETQRKGRIEMANGGTFFLDEIGELKPTLQAKLLRVLQEKSFVRLGGQHTIHCDVRWVAATNRDLPSQVAAGAFREDLYHRLAVFPIHLPPLHQRPEDILPLAKLLLQRISNTLGKPQLILSQALADSLPQQTWPGNVRELSNTLERAAILADGHTIDIAHVSRPQHTPHNTPTPTTTLANVERETIQQALQEVDGNRRKAAQKLGIAERTLYDKIKRYGL